MEWHNKYNPFNSLKALVHVPYWNSIKNNVIPPPLFVSIDPCNKCNFKCNFCNAIEKIKDNDIMSLESMDKIINQLCRWGTKTVCIGGGGEPTLNNNLEFLIKGLHKENIKIGVVTNGSNIKNIINVVSLCEWIGVSIDAAKNDTFQHIKGTKLSIDEILNNVKQIIVSKINNKPEVTYKFLLSPQNYHEVFDAIKIAYDTKCDVIHIRPGCFPWFKDKNDFIFTNEMIKNTLGQIENARTMFESDNFKIYGITHKYNQNWEPKKSFKQCYAIFTTCVIYPNEDVALCCDRRGDPKMVLGKLEDMNLLWGSQIHKNMINGININTCPRCTYTHVNEIIENVVISDKMLYNFF
jgi:wyosine [tRNA(Phe)-imidazoG37] synthetase (radical SAM superfamily)